MNVINESEILVTKSTKIFRRPFLVSLAICGIAAGLVFAINGCSGNGYGSIEKRSKQSSNGEPQVLKIVATTEMVADIVRHVVGAHGTVAGLMGSGTDPHLFKATRNEIKKLYDADVVFYSGLMLEGRMQETLKQVNTAARPVIAVTSGLEANEPGFLRSPPDFEGHFDPHVWMDVNAWSRCTEVVVETMSKVDPAHAGDYEQNAKEYRAELSELDQYVKQVIHSIPESQRVLVTAHDAFGYFGSRYGIDVRSVQGVSTEAEAGIKDVNRLVDFLVERKLPAIFVESSVNEKNIRAVIEGAGSRGVTVKVGGELFSDAMGAEGTYEGTYVGMLDHNATMISQALGGTAPEKGFRNRLNARQN